MTTLWAMWRLLVRLLINPCYGCARRGRCQLSRLLGLYCGDLGMDFYEEKKKGGKGCCDNEKKACRKALGTLMTDDIVRGG